MINGVCYEESVLEMKGTENGMLEAEELGLSNGVNYNFYLKLSDILKHPPEVRMYF